MFQVGDRVVYGVHGVCTVAAAEERVIDRQRRTYLVLEPVGQEGSQFFVPTHNESAMAKLRPMMSREALEQLIVSQQVRQDKWIRDENQRKQAYRQLIGSGDRVALMQMVFTLYQFRSHQSAAGKRIHQCDENFLRDAERLLSGEIAIAMDMKPEDARSYLREKLKCT